MAGEPAARRRAATDVARGSGQVEERQAKLPLWHLLADADTATVVLADRTLAARFGRPPGLPPAAGRLDAPALERWKEHLELQW
jgi:hypothetical protein